MKTVEIIGVPVSATTMHGAVSRILHWVREGSSTFVCVRDVHGIMRSKTDSLLMQAHRDAGMVTPDGMPLVWVCRHRGHKHVERVCGSDLVLSLCTASEHEHIRHFFYGGVKGTAHQMAKHLLEKLPGLTIAGILEPPFPLELGRQEEEDLELIRAARPNIIWVGLSTPKQELWMARHSQSLSGATLIGVGAAFDFYAGSVKRAPVYLQKSGLEWAHRLISNPSRLWRRYLVLGPLFLMSLLLEEIERVRTPSGSYRRG